MYMCQVLPLSVVMWTMMNQVAQITSLSMLLASNSKDPVSQAPQHRQVKIDGDLMLGGLFPVHAKQSYDAQPCGEIMEGRGVHRVEAMLYAVDQINQDKTLLPSLTLGALILDTCGTPAYALNQSLEFVKDLMGTFESSQFECSDGSTAQKKTVGNPVVGVIGGSYSGVSTQIVQISPASTSADLSDKKKYEYFARTVPSDNYQAEVMAHLANRYNWSYVSLIYSAEDYGEMGADAFKQQARANKICIASEEKISSPDKLPEIIKRVVEKSRNSNADTGAKVVILFARNDDVRRILEEFDKLQPTENVVWLASEGWEMSNTTTLGMERSAQGAIVITLQSKRVQSFEDYFLSLHPGHTNFERNAWLGEFWEHHFHCTLDKTKVNEGSNVRLCSPLQRLDRSNFNPDNKVQFVINAVYAMAHALHKMWEDNCHSKYGENTSIECMRPDAIDGEQLYKTYLKNVSFKDMHGTDFHLNKNGDGPARYEILQFHKTANNKTYEYVRLGTWKEGVLDIDDSKLDFGLVSANEVVPPSRCSEDCPPGNRKSLIKDDICCWACIPCPPWEKMVNETTCRDCGQGFWPTPNGTACYDLSLTKLQYMRWKSVYSIIPATLSALGIILTLTVTIVFIKYDKTPVVKASGRELSYILLWGVILCYSMTYVLLAKPTPLMCGVKRVGVGAGLTILYASMLVKTNRIHRIFSSAKRSAVRPSFISPWSQVVITSVFVAVQLIGSGAWLIVVPPGVKYHFPTRQEVVLRCKVADHWFLVSLAYDTALIVMCTIYAVRTRKVPENFNETKFIGFTMYTTCIVWLAFVPIYFGTGDNFQIQTMTMCVSVSLSGSVALFCLFSPKLYVILLEPEKNTIERSSAMSHQSKDLRINPLQQRQDRAASLRVDPIHSPTVFSPLLGGIHIKPYAPTKSCPTPYRRNNALNNEIEQHEKTNEIKGRGMKLSESLDSISSLT